MNTVTLGDLRNHTAEVLDRVAAGEHLTVTRSGRAVAELMPVSQSRATSAEILERWSCLPAVDPAQFRADVDAILKASL